jgi:hypothetical protein
MKHDPDIGTRLSHTATTHVPPVGESNGSKLGGHWLLHVETSIRKHSTSLLTSSKTEHNVFVFGDRNAQFNGAQIFEPSTPRPGP